MTLRSPHELSEVGYRSPDDPDNFMQIVQTLLDKYSNGIISEEVKYADLTEAWQVYRDDLRIQL